MENQILLSLAEEESNLELHVKLCEQRYRQLTNKLDNVDIRLDKIEVHIVAIKDSISAIGKNTTYTYLKWAGVLITVLSSAVIGLIVKVLH